MTAVTDLEDLHVRREGVAGRITLNRPKALNSLTLDMIHVFAAALEGWVGDDGVRVLVIDGAGTRGLCAGGDVRALYESGSRGDGMAETFWRDEYRLNAAIGSYPKPVVAVMDGIVMGGGVGISAHASCRIVTEKTMLAMPEVGIGLLPDVGGVAAVARSGRDRDVSGADGHPDRRRRRDLCRSGGPLRPVGTAGRSGEGAGRGR